MATDSRLQQLSQWIHQTLDGSQATIEVASADASFRRYFRIHHKNKTLIAMDSPPDKEPVQPFIDICQRILATGAHAPHIYHQNIEQGFLILEDLGSTAYLDKLNKDTVDNYYQAAMQALIKLQKVNTTGLPHYDTKRLHEEMTLMPEWFLGEHLGITLTIKQQQIIETTFNSLTSAITEQNTGFVHRDYHSRNLMITETNNPGIIDFQDAVIGPLSYDLVSLLRDCYIAWPHSQVDQWISDYQQMAENAQLIPKMTIEKFSKQVDLIGLQRHIKVLGIFARLKHRDNKPHYLNDLPLTLSYLLDIGQRHKEMTDLMQLFTDLKIADKIGTVVIPQ
ncbi:MAG: phosphotransferase [Thiotrichaceae bacterium]|nr:phosphotransferase [Thiotrichaceae bacterium]